MEAFCVFVGLCGPVQRPCQRTDCKPCMKTTVKRHPSIKYNNLPSTVITAELGRALAVVNVTLQWVQPIFGGMPQKLLGR